MGLDSKKSCKHYPALLRLSGKSLTGY
jgi:hypothetical protein